MSKNDLQGNFLYWLSSISAAPEIKRPPAEAGGLKLLSPFKIQSYLSPRIRLTKTYFQKTRPKQISYYKGTTG